MAQRLHTPEVPLCEWPADVRASYCLDGLPAHPGTGEPLTYGTVISEAHTEVKEYGPPSRPTGELWEYDDSAEGMVFFRSLSPEECSAEDARYQAAMEEWSRCGGRVRISGPVETSGEFRADSGSWVRGTLAAAGWHWTEWETRS